MFMVYLRAFRDNLKRYKLQRLSQYFEENYFKPERIKQWACWYRLKMFNCEWILDTNMHVEAWHDVLKSHVMGKKKNIRIDKLLRILRSAETNNFWKWTRTKVGIRQRSDKRWLAMRGEDTSASVPMSDYGYHDCIDVIDNNSALEYEDRSKLFKDRLKATLTDCLQLISERAVDAARLKIMVQQLDVTRNVLRNAPLQAELPRDGVDDTTEGCTTEEVTTSKRKPKYILVDTKKKGKMSPQKKRYKKRKNKTCNVTTIKSLKKEVNRSNLGFSMRFSAVGWSSLQVPREFPETSQLQLELSVRRKGTVLTLGGIVFLPVIMGMVIPDSDTSFGFEVLNMRVANVYLDSEAHRGGFIECTTCINCALCQIYLIPDPRGDHDHTPVVNK